MTSRRSFQPSYLQIPLTAFASLLTWTAVAIAAEPASPVRKVDPRTRKLIEVDPGQIVPGKIYNHFSPRHNRYVWAFATDGGNFSYALGPGTTESPRNFEVVTSPEETERFLESEIGEWANSLRQSQSELMVRLDANEKWEVLRTPSSRSHFDLDTGRRWEWHGGRKVAVSHTNGYGWRFDGDWYAPTNPWLSAACGQGGCCLDGCCGR